jgi:ribosomal protein S18 acetylase RimI-like enzyme
MSDYHYRRAEACDLESVYALYLALQDHLEAADPDLWRMTPAARQRLRGQLAARLSARESCALVAEHEQQSVVAMILGRIVTNNHYLPARSGSIDQLYVHPAHRRQGIGSQLVAGVWRFFLDHGVEDVALRTMAGNEQAAAFWSALGFTPRILTLGAHLVCGP